MFSFLFRKKVELGAVFDIGSSSVGAGIVKFREGRAPEIVYVTREPIPFQESVDPTRLFNDMIRSLSAVNMRIHKDGLAHLKFTEHGGLHIRHVFYALSSPWSVSQTKVVTIEKSEPVVVTREMVEAVIAKEEKSFESEVIDPSQAPDFKDKLSVIDKKVVQIKLNGYEVAEPLGKKAKTIDISFFMSLAPKTVVDKIIEVSIGAHHPKTTRIGSFPLVLFSTLRDTLRDTQDLVLLDVGGEISDISVVKNGLILETASMPLGKNFLTRRVSRALSVSEAEALSLLRLYFADHADKVTTESLRPVIENASSEWAGALHTVLTGISGSLSLPQDLFVIINNDLVPFFMRALRAEKITQWGVVDVPFKTTLINHDHMKKFVSFAKTAAKDPFIAIGSVYVSKSLSS
jgi:cell division ATPase FtsA